MAYLRTLEIGNPSRADAEKAYASESGDYKALQDYIFRFIAAECGLLLATDRLMQRFGIRRRRLLLLAGIALNPICVLLICQHGSFDVLIAPPSA